MQTFMRLYENLHLFPQMPSCLVNIQPYGIRPQLAVKVSETIQKSFSVTMGRFNQTNSPQNRSHPSKNIEPLTVLAIGGNTQPHTTFGPSSTQPGMQGKPRFIFKNNSLPRLKILKFFLMPSETLWLLLAEPANRCNSPFLNGSPIDEASTEPDALLSLCQSVDSGEPPGSGHPTEFDLSQNLGETFLTDPPIRRQSSDPIEEGVQAWVLFLRLPPLLGLLCASIDSNSDASAPIPRLSTPDAAPPISATKPLSLTRYRPLGFFGQRTKNTLGLLRDASKLMLVSSCLKHFTPILYVSRYLLRLY